MFSKNAIVMLMRFEKAEPGRNRLKFIDSGIYKDLNVLREV